MGPCAPVISARRRGPNASFLFAVILFIILILLCSLVQVAVADSRGQEKAIVRGPSSVPATHPSTAYARPTAMGTLVLALHIKQTPDIRCDRV